MFFDFNLPYTASPSQQDKQTQERLLARIQSLDRATVAWNQVVKDIKAMQPVVAVATKADGPSVTQLTRVTVQVSDPKANYQLVAANPLNQHIDVLAVQPLSIDACRHACQTYDIDIITIDLSQQHPPLPGFAAAQVATQRGVFFEICYTQAIAERATFFANVSRLIKQTRGNNLILSSAAHTALHIKRPTDMHVLGMMFGMTYTEAMAAAYHNYSRVLKKAETRKDTILAAIKIDQLPPDQANKRKQPLSPTPAASQPSKKKKKKSKEAT
ncbi:RNase P subunit p30-domain-containing protein [Gongronella butleri]|nr:RNase P subunit p30-domain-containing protein [Gongronella butleri]